jgi:hypothetical protein
VLEISGSVKIAHSRLITATSTNSSVVFSSGGSRACSAPISASVANLVWPAGYILGLSIIQDGLRIPWHFPVHARRGLHNDHRIAVLQPISLQFAGGFEHGVGY